MYTGFAAKNFRCFRDLRVDGLRRVNLIAGPNNVGKTALLEALFLHSGAFNPALVVGVAGLRGVKAYKIESDRPLEPPWRSLFGQLDESQEIELLGWGTPAMTRELRLRVVRGQINGRLAGGNGKIVPEAERLGSATTETAFQTRERYLALQLDYKGDTSGDGKTLLFFEGGDFKTEPAIVQPPPYRTKLLSARWHPEFKEDAEEFGELELVGKQDRVVRILKTMEPRINRLSIILAGGEPMLHADIGLPRLMPLAFLGDGLLRLTRLVLAVLRSAGGVVMVDEIENGLHHSVLRQIWATLAKTAADNDVQLFATTHSRECVLAAHQALSETLEYDFSLQRLESDRRGVIRAVAYDKEALDGALLAGLEVR